MSSPLRFELQHQDAKTGARAGLLHTRRGIVETPVFMPVGTLATVKGLTPDLVRSTDAKLVLCNTYHLALRPGEDIIDSLGGLHTFMDWPGPILTDSGGFQVFSLAKMNKVTEQGVVFRSHIDGAELDLTPEKSIEIQQNLVVILPWRLIMWSPCPIAKTRLRMPVTVQRGGRPVAESTPSIPIRRYSQSCRVGLIRHCDASLRGTYRRWIFQGTLWGA